MTEPKKNPQKPAGSADAELSAPELLAVVTAVPGVHAIEPGLGTALRTLDARVRRSGTRTAHFGLHIDTDLGAVMVEVALDRSIPVRETVREIQLALRHALAERADAVTRTATEGCSASPEVTVRVQSLQRPG